MDWKGNRKTTFSTIGASNHSEYIREEDDFYATPIDAVEKLLKIEKFNKTIWENACGVGSISEVLINNGYNVISTDLRYRGYVKQKCLLDFLKDSFSVGYPFDIITNPSYKYAEDFVIKGCNYLGKNCKMALLLKLTFLEGQKRKIMFEEYPPEKIYVFSKRITCTRNARFDEFSEKKGAIAYGWYVWTNENLKNKEPPKVY